MTTDNCEVPITELLRGVPINHRLEIEINSTHHRMIPVGVHCHNAAAELEALRKEVEALRQQVAMPLFTKRVVEERDTLRAQNRELREAFDILLQAAKLLKKYQARYHGTPHAQRDWDLGKEILDKLKEKGIEL